MNKFFHVIYEDNHLLVVDKSAGVLVQGDKTGDKCLLDHCKQYIKNKYNKPGDVFLGLPHRLDRPVSGLVILARTSKALERLNEGFRKKKLTKIYWAIVKKKPRTTSNRLQHWIVKNPKNNTVIAHDKEVPESKKAELTYRILGRLNDHYLLEIDLITGRKHQIRAQLAAIGCPIRGDLKYGFSKPNEDGNINLHAKKVSFIHPVKKERVTYYAGVPQTQFWEQFLTLDKRVYK